MNKYEAKRLETQIVWNGKVWVCKHCGGTPERFYIVTGHDHTDDEIDWCPCREVSETDRLRAELSKKEQQLADAQAENLRLTQGIENCRLLAARNRKEAWALLILGFCAEAGVVGSIAR